LGNNVVVRTNDTQGTIRLSISDKIPLNSMYEGVVEMTPDETTEKINIFNV
jgi:hypothetical protein